MSKLLFLVIYVGVLISMTTISVLIISVLGSLCALWAFRLGLIELWLIGLCVIKLCTI